MANTLEAYDIISPYSMLEKCAKFNVDDLSDVFVFSSVMHPQIKYTLSFWVRSDEAGCIWICDNKYNTSLEWKEVIIKFTAENENMDLVFVKTGTYYIYHMQLEVGNIKTDYSPAPEDTDDKFNEYAQ